MSPKPFKPFKPFKRPEKSPYDHDGPSQKALKEALDWIATHDPNTPFSRLIKEVPKPPEPSAEESPVSAPDESVESANAPVEPAIDSEETAPPEPEPKSAKPAVETKPEPEATAPVHAEPAKQEETTNRGQSQPQATREPQIEEEKSEEEYDEENEEVAAQIRSFLRGPQRPPVNSRRIRRADDDDPANISRHRRLCVICHHEDKYAIEQAFLAWHRPNDIKHEFRLPNRMCIYRHARAAGLFEKRARNLRSALEKVMEESTCRPPSADSIIRAVRVYGCLDANGRWVEPARNLIITHNTHRDPHPEPAPARRGGLPVHANDDPAAPGKRLISVDPTVIEEEKGA